MALRDQPYFPLYVDDFMTDERLNLCSAEATGVYIRLMCLMHKMDEYGVVSLSKLDKVSSDQIQNFTTLLSKQMPYENDVIFRSILELFERKVIQIKGDKLIQKRMVKDGETSKKRAIAGAKGGKQKSSKTLANNKANDEQNTVNVVVVVNEDENIDLSSSNDETTDARTKSISQVMTLFMDNIVVKPSSEIVDMLVSYTDDMGADVVCKAINIAIGENLRKWSYIRGILQNWSSQKVKSLADVDRLEAQRSATKAQTGSKTQDSGNIFADMYRERKGNDNR